MIHLQFGCHWTGRQWACCQHQSNGRASWCLTTKRKKHTYWRAAESTGDEEELAVKRWFIIDQIQVKPCTGKDKEYKTLTPISNICEWISNALHLTLSELLFAVLLGDFYLENLELTDEGGHLCEALSTRPPNTNQQHVSPELTDHTYYTCYCGENRKI